MKLIGLTGPAGTGKDTVANILKERGFHTYAIADTLRRGLDAMFGIGADCTIRDQKEKPIEWLHGRSPRELMQSLGDWVRDIAPNPRFTRHCDNASCQHNINNTCENGTARQDPALLCGEYIAETYPSILLDQANQRWLAMLHDNTKTFGDMEAGLVITDIRTLEEANWIRENGILWHINRQTEAVAQHHTEIRVGIKPGDLEVMNHGSIQDLRNQVFQTLELMNQPTTNIENTTPGTGLVTAMQRGSKLHTTQVSIELDQDGYGTLHIGNNREVFGSLEELYELLTTPPKPPQEAAATPPKREYPSCMVSDKPQQSNAA